MAYSFTADCSLGNDLEFVVPAGIAEGSLEITESGDVINMSNSTIYLYCPSYPHYTFSLSRFSGVTYRTGTSYDGTRDLVLSDVSHSPIFSPVSDAVPELFFLGICALCCLIMAFFGSGKR